jgi:transcriptional regulator with XRE-family HTH domain
MLYVRAGGKGGYMAGRDYGLTDFEAEFIRTPAQRLAFERKLARLLIGHKVADLRASAGMTQAELARRLGTRQQVVSRLEQARYKPSIRTLENIARVFSRRLEINLGDTVTQHLIPPQGNAGGFVLPRKGTKRLLYAPWVSRDHGPDN